MQISKICPKFINFGSVKKSAVEKRIELACGNTFILKGVKEIIDEQRDNNRYDVIGLPSHEHYNYMVVKRGESDGQRFMNFQNACRYADMKERADIIGEHKEPDWKQQKAEFEKFAKELLDSCEE